MESLSSINLLIATVLLLLIVASAVAVTANRMRIPYTVGLVLMGLAMALFAPSFLAGDTGINYKQFLDISHNPLLPKIILGLLVPPLVFEAAYHIRFEDLKKDFWMIVMFAIPGLVITTLLGGMISWGLNLTQFGVSISLPVAMVFGAEWLPQIQWLWLPSSAAWVCPSACRCCLGGRELVQ